MIYLYAEPTAKTLDLCALSQYLKELLSCPVEVRESFINFHLSPLSKEAKEKSISYLAQRFAEARVRNPFRHEDFPPLAGEIEYERRRLEGQSHAFGILYDGLKIVEILHQLILKEERKLGLIHITFTNQLFGTWEEVDRRYHARVSLYSFPSIISTTGIVEAPAKPREYYFLKQQYAALGMPDATVALDSQFRGRFIEHDDTRLTEVMKGYIMQAVFHHLGEEPFCPDKDCRLYNAHWQEEVIRAQLNGRFEFCPAHQRKLDELRERLARAK